MIVSESIIAGPEGIFRLYEKYKPESIPKNEKIPEKIIIK